MAVKQKRDVTWQKARIAEGLCVVCGCEREFVTRGLCDSHKAAFYSRLKECRDEEGKAAAEELEKEMIEAGHVLEPREQQAWTSKNPFKQFRSPAGRSEDSK